MFPFKPQTKENDTISYNRNEGFERTGESRWALNCSEAGNYGTVRNSEGKHLLPIKCVPRGN